MAAGKLAEKPFFDGLLAGDAGLWSAILRCNAHPRPAREAWGPFSAAASVGLDAWLAQSPDSARPVGETGQEAVFFWDFEEESRKLALLEDAQLQRLAAVVGVTLHAPALAKIVERKARLACREALGAEFFDYAQTRGQYVAGAAVDIMARRDEALPLPERCRLHGWRALSLCSLRWPKGLGRVFQARLAHLAGDVGTSVNGERPLGDSAWQALWRLVKKCLLREVAPSWARIFTA